MRAFGNALRDSAIELSVITPVHDEVENLPTLVDQVGRALGALGEPFELIVVDDGSDDGSAEAVRRCMIDRPWLRLILLPPAPGGGGNGQSAAFRAGFQAARGRLLASLDGDLQNDPADLPRMRAWMRETAADLVQGDRSQSRQDSWPRRLGSRVGRLYRRVLLGDRIRDTGCSLRLMKRELALALPLDFAGLHRFIPLLAGQLGYRVVEMPVAHRPRRAGRSKYGRGLSRALPGLVDGLGVRWMHSRRRRVEADEAKRASRAEPDAGAA